MRANVLPPLNGFVRPVASDRFPGKVLSKLPVPSAMTKPAIDQMQEVAIAEIATGDPHRIRLVVQKLAKGWPEEKALTLCFALTAAASHFEDLMRPTGRMQDAAAKAYKMAALVAADILAIEAMGLAPARARDLLIYWKRVDPYFLHPEGRK
ncbi:hypothetical protein [Marivivens marinus]|uniref:hypothetical protein n=1 Tax=Marivivens marinus TaxID=3110173 RepID=UPI003B84929D